MKQDRTANVGTIEHRTDSATDSITTLVASGKPAELPSGEFLTDLARRLSADPARTFTSERLYVVLTMSARLTHNCASYNADASRVWSDNKNGSWHTRETRQRTIRDADDLADYAWDTATEDADRAFALLAPAGESVTAAELAARVDALRSAVWTVSDRVLKAVA